MSGAATNGASEELKQALSLDSLFGIKGLVAVVTGGGTGWVNYYPGNRKLFTFLSSASSFRDGISRDTPHKYLISSPSYPSFHQRV
jgi:hypothetical protein